MVDQNSFFRERPFFANKNVSFEKLSRTPCLSSAGPMLANNTSYEDSFTCQITPENHGSTCSKHHKVPSQDRLLLTRFFWQGLLAHPLQHALWLLPAPSHNFRGTFAKISLFTDPDHQQGVHWRKSEHQGPWCLALAKLGNLATACRACFLRLQTASLGSDSGRCKDALQDHGVWLSRSLAFGSSAATYEGQGDCPQAPPHRELNQNQTKILWCPSPAGPRAAVGGSPLHNNYNIQLSRNFRKKTCYFRELERNFREGFQHNMQGFRN